MIDNHDDDNDDEDRVDDDDDVGNSHYSLNDVMLDDIFFLYGTGQDHCNRLILKCMVYKNNNDDHGKLNKVCQYDHDDDDEEGADSFILKLI